MVAVVVGDVPVAELSRTAGAGQGTERPLLHRFSQVMVAGQPARGDVFALPGTLLVGLGRTSAGSRRAEQQLAHSFLPDPELPADGQQLGRGQPDGVGLGPHEIVMGTERLTVQRGGDLVGEAGPASRGARPGRDR